MLASAPALCVVGSLMPGTRVGKDHYLLPGPRPGSKLCSILWI
ncbi:hypothetical protein [Corynebacterium hindlerae]|nr:hypothetical protein [Corynebacterium hindlerae]